MEIRGERECTECGTRWSYYEIGGVGCPACGSLRSVGLDERTTHTDLAVTLDLTPVRAVVDDDSTEELARQARGYCREYVTRRGFIAGGTLCDLDDAYLAAKELVHVADVVSRRLRLDEREELYFLSLIREADEGGRPAAEDVPSSLQHARGLAYANAIRAYRRDVRTWANEGGIDPTGRSVFELLGDHVTRIRMLDGDVSPETAERLVAATRDVADGLRGDDDALENARNRLSRLG